ncbi:hypothetical protein [Maritimibacter alkaliphilus]|uniref:hypothetical protein n=1 Tax=Maritimibacter alkaliphilus TaxID=404236 RepID=UPI001C94C20D|nr:hypothetical protein [Maritimibacter alkaliphilus]MBY6091063.1 hypothetical protein [Maritimibacter alkaliphilus]
MTRDYDIGVLVLVASVHYDAAGRLVRLAAWLFGRHQTFAHMGRSGRIAFWRGTPYLLTFREDH